MKGMIFLKTIVFGVQHLLTMFSATVLVPVLLGIPISVSLFTSGLGTLIFHIITKRKVPIYLGSSFAFIKPVAWRPVNSFTGGKATTSLFNILNFSSPIHV